MFIIHVKDAASAAKLNKHLDSGHHVFALIYMEGCGPCNAARPEWGKLKRTLGQQYKRNKSPNAFPTIIYISPNKIENFENSSINDKSRNVDCFMNWIESHVSKPEVLSNYTNVHKKHSHRPYYKQKKTHKGRNRHNYSNTTGGRRSRTKRRRMY